MSYPEITLKPIGIIHTPFKGVSDHIPIQSRLQPGSDGFVELFHEYVDGCRDLEGFSHIFLLYRFHIAGDERLITKPYMDTVPRGVFSTRSPHRPNHIGLSLVRLVSINQGMLMVRDLDIVDGTPLLDIKPYIPRFDTVSADGKVRIGWIENISGDTIDREKTRTKSHKEWLQEYE